ncbi:hypothetical protein BC332_17148 [Capsicum chinense]|nr:hypothetical protein BC332_17148 [Capsicum chinense]
MEDSPSFSLGLTQLDTNAVVGFVPEIFNYEEPNFVENISKFRNNLNKMKEIRKTAGKKSKKTVEKSSRLSKKDDSGRPRLPKLYSMGGMPYVLNVWIYEYCSEVDGTIAERMENVIPRIFNWQVVGIKVKYEKFMAGMFSKLVYNNIRPTDEEVQSFDLQMIEGFQLKEVESGFPPKIAADYFDKRLVVDVQSQVDLDIQVRFDSTTVEEKVCQKTPSFVSTRTVPTQKTASSGSEHVHAEKTTPSSSLKSVCQDNSDEKWDDIKLFLQFYDVKGCSEDNATAILDALVESVVNHNSDNTNAGTHTTVHVHNDHMDDEGVSADFRPATLECLVAAVENQKPDNDNVGTSNMQIDYSSTLPESAQVELDAILKVIAAPVDDVPIEMVKRIRTRSKVFKSPYTIEYVSGSKAIEDQIEEQKQQFAFDGFLISDTMSSSVAGYAEYLSEEMNVPADGFEAEYHRMCYATLLRKYGIQKVKKSYVSETDDPPKSKSRIIQIPDDNAIVCIE